MELAVGHIEPITLQLNVECCEGLETDQIVHHIGGVRVVCAVVELAHGARRIFEQVILLSDIVLVLGIEDAHGFAQIPVS